MSGSSLLWEFDKSSEEADGDTSSSSSSWEELRLGSLLRLNTKLRLASSSSAAGGDPTSPRNKRDSKDAGGAKDGGSALPWDDNDEATKKSQLYSFQAANSDTGGMFVGYVTTGILGHSIDILNRLIIPCGPLNSFDSEGQSPL